MKSLFFSSFIVTLAVTCTSCGGVTTTSMLDQNNIGGKVVQSTSVPTSLTVHALTWSGSAWTQSGKASAVSSDGSYHINNIGTGEYKFAVVNSSGSTLYQTSYTYTFSPPTGTITWTVNLTF